jgi:ornithine decarboxylase
MNSVRSYNDDVLRKNRKKNNKSKKKNPSVSSPKKPKLRKQQSNNGSVTYVPEETQTCSKLDSSSVFEQLDSSFQSNTENLELFVQEELKDRFNVNVPVSDHVEHTEWIKSIIDKHKNVPVFSTVDLGRLIYQARLWKKCLPRVQPYYAVKSNPDMNILRTLYILGVNFDCASKGEIEQVLGLGAEPTQIIYANPAKGFDHIEYAREKDVRQMTFDNIVELKKIIQCYPDAELVLRISSNDTMSLLPFGYKFGARTDDAIALIAACVELKANLVGISFHVGSGCYSPVGFIDTLHRARDMFSEAEKHGLSLSILDIGGGFPGDNEGTITFSDLASAIAPVIDALFPSNIHIIAEPGRFFCTSTTSIALQIYAKREYVVRRLEPETNEMIEIKETQYYCPDGVYGNFNNIIYDHAKPICRPLYEPPLDALLYNSTFFGPTCDSIDVIAKNISFPDLNLGEWIYFANMGAYTIAAGSCFNGFERPPIFYGIFLYGALS